MQILCTKIANYAIIIAIAAWRALRETRESCQSCLIVFAVAGQPSRLMAGKDGDDPFGGVAVP